MGGGRVGEWGRRGGLSPPVWFCWRNIVVSFFFSPLRPLLPAVSVRSETRCCFVGVQLEGIILVAACVSGFDAGADCGAGSSVRHTAALRRLSGFKPQQDETRRGSGG